MIAVGKKATVDGSVMVARSPDALGDYAIQVRSVERKKHGSDEVIRFFEQGITIPQVETTYAYIGLMGVVEGEDISIAEGGINEFQVTAGASTGGNLNQKARMVCPRMTSSIGDYRMTLVLERCKTAREGIKLIGEFTEKYGAGTDNYIVADPKEAWIYEEYQGKLWAAVRVPDDCFFIEANTVRIEEVNQDEPEKYLCSDNLIDFAIGNGLYDPKNGSFNAMKVYGAQSGKVRHGIPAPNYDRRRIWRGITLLAPSTNLDPEDPSWTYPLFVKPDKKLSPKEILSMYTDHYQESEYDHYGMNQKNYFPAKSAMRSGATKSKTLERSYFHINKTRQYQLAPIWGTERIIGTPRAVSTWCTQMRDWMPNQIGGLIWAGLAEGATSGRIPWYSGITRTPKQYTMGTLREGGIPKAPFHGSVYDDKSAYWTFRLLSNLVNLFYTATKDEVIPIWREWEDKLFKLQPVIEKVALELWEKNQDLAIEFLTSYSCAKALEAYEIAKDMGERLHTIIAHYNAPL